MRWVQGLIVSWFVHFTVLKSIKALDQTKSDNPEERQERCNRKITGHFSDVRDEQCLSLTIMS